jgi:hypothetical protein
MTLRMIAAIALLMMSTALGACGGDDETTGGETTSGGEVTATQDKESTAPKPTVETIVIRNGKPVGGVRELDYTAGEQVRFRVRSDVADEIHIHGYELSEEVAAGGSASFSFPADIEGIFEVELEGRAEQIAELRIDP